MIDKELNRLFLIEEKNEYLGNNKEINKQTPLVSISVPTYNHENYIEECLESILNQVTNFTFEIIVGEDESDDNTREICIKYAEKYPNKIRLFLRDRKTSQYFEKGKFRCRFNALWNRMSAKGKYVAICEGDDYWVDPLKLQKQVDFLEANEEYGFCFTRFYTLESSGIIENDKNEKHFVNDTEEFINFTFELFSKGWHVGTQTILYRKSIFKTEMVKKYKNFKDVVLFSELLNKSKGACLAFFGAVYRKHDNGIYSGMSKLNVLKTAYLTYRELYFKNYKNIFLKKKYVNFCSSYIIALWNKGKYKMFFKELLINSLWFNNYRYIFFSSYKRTITFLKR